jgi:hypothetical protein
MNPFRRPTHTRRPFRMDAIPQAPHPALVARIRARLRALADSLAWPFSESPTWNGDLFTVRNGYRASVEAGGAESDPWLRRS